jgi:ribosomal protein S2
MKLEKIRKRRSTIVRFHLMKARVYTKNLYLKNIQIEDIECRLKKALHVIYRFYVCRKKIVFVGAPKNESRYLKSLLEKTKHAVIPEGVWLKGIITNPVPNFRRLPHYRKIANFPKILLQLKKRSNLIVSLNSLGSAIVLEEGYDKRIPIISFNPSVLDITDVKSSYKIPGIFISNKNKMRGSFLISTLTAILRKANKQKQPVRKKTRMKSSKFWRKPSRYRTFRPFSPFRPFRPFRPFKHTRHR